MLPCVSCSWSLAFWWGLFRRYSTTSGWLVQAAKDKGSSPEEMRTVFEGKAETGEKELKKNKSNSKKIYIAYRFTTGTQNKFFLSVSRFRKGFVVNYYLFLGAAQALSQTPNLVKLTKSLFLSEAPQMGLKHIKPKMMPNAHWTPQSVKGSCHSSKSRA